MDLDAPVRPIDPQDDARRVDQAVHARDHRLLDLLLTVVNPIIGVAMGGVLGGWHADAPVVGALGMLLAFSAAYGALQGAGFVALLIEGPGLLRHLGTPGGPRRRWRPAGGGFATFAAVAVYAIVYGGGAALTGVVAGFMGEGDPHLPDVVAFALLGTGLGVALPFSEWS